METNAIKRYPVRVSILIAILFVISLIGVITGVINNDETKSNLITLLIFSSLASGLAMCLLYLAYPAIKHSRISQYVLFFNVAILITTLAMTVYNVRFKDLEFAHLPDSLKMMYSLSVVAIIWLLTRILFRRRIQNT